MAGLFSPLELRGVTLKNRIALSPMQQYSANDGLANDWHLVHLGSRAVGGAGLVISEAIVVNETARWTKHDIGLYRDDQVEPLKRITDFIKSQDSIPFVQLGHAGGKGSLSHPSDGFQFLTPEEGGWELVAASPFEAAPGRPLPREITKEEIRQTLEDYKSAAKRAIEAGFEGIEIHAAHGYLIHEFYSEIVNKRADEYGGPFQNRIRFFLEVVDMIRSVVPDNCPVIARISATDYIDSSEAWTPDDSVRMSKILKEHGVDLITASGGGFAFVPRELSGSGYQAEFAEKIRREAGIATGAVGKIISPEQAGHIILSGQADLAVIGREFLRNPYFGLHAQKALSGKLNPPIQYKRAFK